MKESVEIHAAAKTRGGPSAHPKLGKAADRVLKKKSEEIAESLGENAAKGSVQSTRLLLELSELSGKPEHKSHSESKLVEQWKAEPEWTDEEATQE